MEIAFFDSHRYEREAFEAVNPGFGHRLTYLEPRLTRETALITAHQGFLTREALANIARSPSTT